MSTQITPIKALHSVTYGTASKAAAKEMGLALAGGEAVDDYYTLRAQSEALLNGILNNRGFMEVANKGLFKGQEGYFYSEGNSDFLTSFVEGDEYEEKLYEARSYGAFMAFQLGRDVGQITFLKLVAEKGLSGGAAAFSWKDLGELILQDMGRAAVQSYSGLKTFLGNNSVPGKKGATAKKAFQRGLLGAEVGLEGFTEFTSPNGNIVHFDLVQAEEESLSGIAQAANDAILPYAQDEFTTGISHAMVIQNYTDQELELTITYQNKESGLLIGPADIYKGSKVPSFVENGKEVGLEGVEAHRPLCGEASFLILSNTPESDIAYTLEINICGTPHKIVTGFDLPQLSQNSSFILFNPSGTGEEIFNGQKGKNTDESITLTHADMGVTLAHNSTSSQTTKLSTGEEGYYYRSVLAVYDKTQPPQKAGLTPLDGLLFGGRL